MKKAKKILVMVAALALTAALAIGGTLAYLTSEDSVKNTFTVGKVAITLDETNVDNDKYKNEKGEMETPARDQANDYKLMPGSTYIKDPIVHVSSDSEAAWLFVKLENGLKDIIDDTTIEAQMVANTWTLIDADNNIYAYGTPVSAGANVNTFANFTIKDDVSNETLLTYEGKTIVVTAYAVQKENFASAQAAWTDTFGA